MENVRKFDYANYVCGLLLPSACRRGFFALRCLNLELAAIVDMASSPDHARFRALWWRDSVKSVLNMGKAKDFHPVLEELALLVKEKEITKAFLIKLITARVQDIEVSSYPTMVELEKFGEATASSLLYLSLECGNIRDSAAEHAASHLGKALAITTFLRGTPQNALKRKAYLPLQALAHKELPLEKVFRHFDPDAENLDTDEEQQLADVVFEVASVAKAHIQTARNLASSVPPAATYHFLPALVCDSFLDRLEAARFDLNNPAVQKNGIPLPLLLRLPLYKWTHRF